MHSGGLLDFRAISFKREWGSQQSYAEREARRLLRLSQKITRVQEDSWHSNSTSRR